MIMTCGYCFKPINTASEGNYVIYGAGTSAANVEHTFCHFSRFPQDHWLFCGDAEYVKLDPKEE
jgi:hypothetical protein